MTLNGRLKHVLLGAGAAGAFLGGFMAARSTAPIPPAVLVPLPEQRLQGIELKLEVISRDVGGVKEDLAAIKCRLNIGGVCPPEQGR